ncbi:MAG: hypothetical protein JXP34_05820 [Planctomycetes bacterium]|nr:hypothetical protein [Planctomycetota bacterium]
MAYARAGGAPSIEISYLPLSAMLIQGICPFTQVCGIRASAVQRAPGATAFARRSGSPASLEAVTVPPLEKAIFPSR